MAYNQTVGWECAEVVRVFIGVSQMLNIRGVLQESNSKGVETNILSGKGHFVRFLGELKRFLDF
jgi:hypothetical protein